MTAIAFLNTRQENSENIYFGDYNLIHFWFSIFLKGLLIAIMAGGQVNLLRI